MTTPGEHKRILKERHNQVLELLGELEHKANFVYRLENTDELTDMINNLTLALYYPEGVTK